MRDGLMDWFVGRNLGREVGERETDGWRERG